MNKQFSSSVIRLYCFPYAGGSAAFYKSWKRYLAPYIQVIPVELAGRGKRMSEPLNQNLEEMIEDAWLQVKDDLQYGGNYACFGHSLGSILVYYLAQRIKKLALTPPMHLFFSGRAAPHLPANLSSIHQLPEAAFRETILRMGGAPKALFDHSLYAQRLLPVLRNDFRLVETFKTTTEIDPLKSDISVCVGKKDLFPDDEIAAWKWHSSGVCSIHYFPGGHFFIHDQVAALTGFIQNSLCQPVPKP